MVGEQIGFDEGGVFQSLSGSLYTRTTTEYTYRKDKLVEETTTVINVTGAHVLAAMLGPALIALIIATKDLDKDVKTAILAGSPFGAAGLAVAWGLTSIDTDNDGGKLGDSSGKRSFADWLDILSRHS